MPSQTVKRIKHPMREFSLDRSGRQEYAELRVAYADMQVLEESMPQHMTTLKSAYDEYVSSRAIDYMTISLESSALLYSLMEILRPPRVLDLGCGFSSYVLRKQAQDSNAASEVVSVNNDIDSLEKTRRHLVKHNLPSDNMLSWEDMSAAHPKPFDLVFHNLGNMAVRAQTLPWVQSHLSSGGFALLDDVHKPNYRKTVLDSIAESKFEFFSMRAITHDQFGRYSVLLHNPA